MFAMAENKFGHVNSQELIMAMPEMAGIQQTLSELETEWENVLLSMREEYFSKFRDYQERRATMPESIREMRESELMDLEQRITAFQQTATADLQRRQQELLAPVIEKVRLAIRDVGIENELIYIFDMAAQSIVFHSPTKAKDVTALVKTKLGIR